MSQVCRFFYTFEDGYPDVCGYGLEEEHVEERHRFCQKKENICGVTGSADLISHEGFSCTCVLVDRLSFQAGQLGWANPMPLKA
jgi:hypothetical protein